MALIRTLSLLAILVCSVAHGQAKAQIDGPETQQAGNLVVLNSVASISDALEWVIPDSLAGRYIRTGEQLAFSVRESGTFTFHLVAVTVDETNSADIDVATHTVTITDGFGDPCPDPGQPPTDPDEPEQPDQPEPDFDGLRKLSADAAGRLNDPKTAKQLVSVLRGIKLAELPVMRATVRGGIEAVLLGRDAESQQKDWLEEWRKPVDAAIEVETPEQYLAALKAIAAGLDESPSNAPAPAPTPSKLITIYTRPNCSWCQKWKAEVMPGLESSGWEIKQVLDSGSVPRFDVIVDGKKHLLTGFHQSESFTKFLK